MNSFAGHLGRTTLITILGSVILGWPLTILNPFLPHLLDSKIAKTYENIQLLIFLVLASIVILLVIKRYIHYEKKGPIKEVIDSFLYNSNLAIVATLAIYIILSIIIRRNAPSSFIFIPNMLIIFSGALYSVILVATLYILVQSPKSFTGYLKRFLFMLIQSFVVTVLLMLYQYGLVNHFEGHFFPTFLNTMPLKNNDTLSWFNITFAECRIYIFISLVGAAASAIVARFYRAAKNDNYAGISLSQKRRILQANIIEYQPVIQQKLTEIKNLCSEMDDTNHIHYVTNNERIEFYQYFDQKILDCFGSLLNAGDTQLNFDSCVSFFKEATDKEIPILSDVLPKDEMYEKNSWENIYIQEWKAYGINPSGIEQTARRFYDALFSNMKSTYYEAENDMHGIEKGEHGEENVHKTLMQVFQDMDTYLLRNINIKYEEASAEIDEIVISRFGIFLIEVKNIGQESSKYEYVIRNDFQEYRRYENGNLIPVEKNICGQIAYHQQAFVHMICAAHQISAEINPYTIVKSILVIANNQLKLENQSALTVTRSNTLSHSISALMSSTPILSTQQMKMILHTIKAYEVPAKSFEILDCYEKIRKSVQNGTEILKIYHSIISMLEQTYNGKLQGETTEINTYNTHATM